MAIRRTGHILSICLVLLVVGCATGISQHARSQITYMGAFSELLKTSGAYVGEVVLLGGKILETRASPTSSELTVLQLPLDRRDQPVHLDQSEGRFLVRSEQFFDPAIYQKGTLLTVVGRLRGSEVRAIGDFDYVYPILEAIEIKLWPQAQRTYPRLHFGIGVGATF